MKLLTKVATGVKFGDVSNQAVRNVLTELSNRLYGGITEQEMEDTMETEFHWECPYTGRDLKQAVADKDGTYATDHICPQNREWCGLNVKGNLIIVDKEANRQKGKMDVETFMTTDSPYWDKLGITLPTRLARLKAIQDFQKKCGYDPQCIRQVVAPMVKAHYDAVRVQQESAIQDVVDALSVVGIHALKKPVASAMVSAKKGGGKSAIELVFHPADEQQFKDALLKSKKAHFKLTYNSGKEVISSWDASSFDRDSKLRGNIQSRPFWRNGKKEGLIRVEVFVD